MRCIADNYGGGPVGVETMAAALSEQRDVLEEVIEPYLIQQGLVQRTPRGRMLTRGAFSYLGLDAPGSLEQLDLLGEDPGGAPDSGEGAA
jgi:Holliday junction DNA helicase RuvB